VIAKDPISQNRDGVSCLGGGPNYQFAVKLLKVGMQMEKITKIFNVSKDPEVSQKIRDAMEAIFESLKDIENRLHALEIRMTLISKDTHGS